MLALLQHTVFLVCLVVSLWPNPTSPGSLRPHQHLPLCSGHTDLIFSGSSRQPLSLLFSSLLSLVSPVPNEYSLFSWGLSTANCYFPHESHLAGFSSDFNKIFYFNTCTTPALKSVHSLRGSMSVRLTLCFHYFPQYQGYRVNSIWTIILPLGHAFLKSIHQYHQYHCVGYNLVLSELLLYLWMEMELDMW